MENASENSNLIPVFSREMTMEARFTFTSPTSTISPTVESRTRNSFRQGITTASEGQKRASHWHWNDEGAHCSVECGRTGLSLQYESSPFDYDKSTYSTLPRQSKIPQPRCDGDSSRLQPLVEPPRHHVARPYERRCKSTAQITLKQVDETSNRRPKAKASEFHGSTDHESAQKRQFPTSPSHCCACNSALINTTPNHQQLCSCLHCATLQKLVRTLTHHDCYNNVHPTHHASPPSTSYRPDDFRPSRGLQSFNSHQRYQLPSSSSVYKKEEKHDSSCGRPRETTPIPTSRSPSPFERRTSKGSRLETSEKKQDRSKKTRAKIHSKSKTRPKTIHIDVYCSSSSSSTEGDTTDQMSDALDGSILTEGRRPSEALLSLGSKKNHKKSDFLLCPRDHERKSNATTRTGSFVYRSKNRNDSPTVPAFMTDHPLSLCSSSPPLERPASSPPMVTLRNESPRDSSDGGTIPLAYPMKPSTLPLSPLYTSGYPPRNYPGTPPGRERAQIHRRTGSWESGSAISGNTPAMNYLDPFFRQNVDISSIYGEFENLCIRRDLEERDESIMPWRSPKLERKKYLAQSQEPCPKTIDNLETRRTYHDSTCSSEEMTLKISTPSTIQSDSIRTPTEVSDLAKMSMFKDFSEEELQVISKSLTKRESERSRSTEKSRPISRHSSFTFPRRGSFRDSADEFANMQPDTHTSLSSTQAVEPGEVTLTVKEKEDDRSHLFRKSYENTKLVKFMDESGDKTTCQPSTQQSPDYTSKKYPKYGRPINVGLFRRINRFPFNAISHPSPRGSGVYSQIRVNESRSIRPHVFGEALVRANRRQGIHFGPPRNPQCSCLNCLSHFRPDQNSLLGCRLKSQSLSDLNPVVSLDHSPE